MRKNVLNVVVFMFLAGGLFFLWQYAEKNMPKPPVKDAETKQREADEEAKKVAELKEKLDAEDKARDARQTAREAAAGGLAAALDLPKAKPPESPPADPPVQLFGIELRAAHDAVARGVRDAARRPTLVALGDESFYNRVLLSTRGGGVQQVVLPKFGHADRLGRDVKLKDANGVPTGGTLRLHLIPGISHPRAKHLREDYTPPDLVPGPVANPAALAEPSFTVFAYPTPDDNNPDPYLGETNWAVVEESRPADGPHTVAFEKELGEPYFLVIRKTYTLAPKDYHVGLRIDIRKKSKEEGAAKGKGQLRYQLSGPRGLPIEGEWYTSTYRVAVTGWRDGRGTPRRQYEDAAGIGAKRGGEQVKRGDNTFHYMAVANQYFASAVTIDYPAGEPTRRHPWAYVRATTELPLDKKQDPNQPNFDDITVRAASEMIDLAPGESVSHRYFIYNGPAKVGLLKLMPKEGDEPAVRTDLVDTYKDAMMLSTLTDFRSDTWLGRFASFIYWTDLVIAMTNLMHLLLAFIHSILVWTGSGAWALSIVLLTVCVRLVLFYPSRKQTAMSMKMMEVQKRLQPELEKLQEQYKDDFNGYNREKTRLMMQHGANPFAMAGGCLLLFAQMPVMMGLYFGLQESVFFRLDHFLWIDNLAAPDMLKWWSETIPYVSTPEDIGSMLYLGPYFNLLPLLAVSLMLYQQSKMMPPSTDPQAEQQRVMMKIMMCMMAVFFYKVAAGLALYFIVSTGWAIIERQFIPKPVIDVGPPPDAGGKGAKSAKPGGGPDGKMTPAEIAAAAQGKSKGFLTRLREQLQEKMEEMQRKADEQSRRQIRNDPNRPGGGSSPPPGTDGQPPDGPRRDKKNKRRKK